jgi:hypothetical protein
MTARVTAAATVVNLTDGNEYEFLPLTDRDIDELEEWLQSRLITIARNSLDENCDQQQRDEIIKMAIREGAKVTWRSQQGLEMLANPKGIAQIAYYSMRKRHPELKIATLRELMQHSENVAEINRAMRRVNFAEVIANANDNGSKMPGKAERKLSRKK